MRIISDTLPKIGKCRVTETKSIVFLNQMKNVRFFRVLRELPSHRLSESSFGISKTHIQVFLQDAASHKDCALPPRVLSARNKRHNMTTPGAFSSTYREGCCMRHTEQVQQEPGRSARVSAEPCPETLAPSPTGPAVSTWTPWQDQRPSSLQMPETGSHSAPQRVTWVEAVFSSWLSFAVVKPGLPHEHSRDISSLLGASLHTPFRVSRLKDKADEAVWVALSPGTVSKPESHAAGRHCCWINSLTGSMGVANKLRSSAVASKW